MDVYLRQCRKITNDVIKKHDKLLYLNLYENRVVTDLSNQRYIKQLQISMASIGYEGIKHLKDLEVLNISNNSNYFDITNFQNLRELYIRGFNNIRYEDLLKLPKLQTVHVISNYYKKDIIALLKNKVKVED
jgi:Leucine-rich repeat (LRR) protein